MREEQEKRVREAKEKRVREAKEKRVRGAGEGSGCEERVRGHSDALGHTRAAHDRTPIRRTRPHKSCT